MVEVGKTYKHFDDGKLWISRMYNSTILMIIPFEEASEDLLEAWELEVKMFPHLYSATTKAFIKAQLDEKVGFEDRGLAFYVESTHPGWYSLGMEGGRLDVDGSLYEKYVLPHT